MDENKLRKASILVTSLEKEVANQLLNQLPGDQAARVLSFSRNLGEVTADERRQVVNEFMQLGPLIRQPTNSGIELDGSLAEKFAISPPSTEIDLEHRSNHYGKTSVKAVPFESIREADIEPMALLLAREHPQTIAVVLSHLPSEIAIEVIGRLTPRLQAIVVRRWIELDETDPDILLEIEGELQKELQHRLQSDQRRDSQLAHLQTILKAANQEQRHRLTANLLRYDTELARAIGVGEQRENSASTLDPSSKRMHRPQCVSVSDQTAFVRHSIKRKSIHVGDSTTSSGKSRQNAIQRFQDIARLDNRNLRTLLETADPDVALLALIGAEERLIGRILSLCSPGHSRDLRQRLHQIEPTTLRDVEQAQLELTAMASRLVSDSVLAKSH